MVLIHCKKCNRTWDYTGKNEFYATCSRCNLKKSIRLNTVKPENGKD